MSDFISKTRSNERYAGQKSWLEDLLRKYAEVFLKMNEWDIENAIAESKNPNSDTFFYSYYTLILKTLAQANEKDTGKFTNT